jgi:Kef-type K+ transport system membrane component KefB
MDAMTDAWIAMAMGLLIFLAAMVSVELGISVALIEIALGVLAGNVLGLQTTPWIDFLAGFGSIVLTFLAGAEVDTRLLRDQFKASMLIGGLSFLLPFLGAWAFALWVLGWAPAAAKIAGVALSTTSLAVVYAVLVETGLTGTPLGKLIMASTFITDFGTAAALSILFISPTPWIFGFLGVSVAVIVIMPRLQPWFFRRYGNRVIEPEIKGAFAALLVLMYVGRLAESHAVLPAFVLGLAVSSVFAAHRAEQQRFRVVAFAMLTPFFFIKAGLNVGLGAISANLVVLGLLVAVKMVTKFIGVLPMARRYVGAHAMYTTLLMSTGLTFGTISSLYGLQAGILDQAQFSLLVTTVILSAVVPTIIAQRFYDPRRAGVHAAPASSVLTLTPAEKGEE